MSTVTSTLMCSVVAAGTLLLGGCGGATPSKFPTAMLKGAVTIDGAPVERGQLNFQPLGSGQSATAVIEQGQYSLNAAPHGKVRVVFTITRETGKMNTEYSQPIPEVENLVPAADRSGREIDVSGDGTHDFALTSK